MTKHYLKLSVAIFAILITGLLFFLPIGSNDIQSTKVSKIEKVKKFQTPKEIINAALRAKAEKRKNGYAKSDSPDEYAKYHQAIRIKEGESTQKYLPNYRMAELNKAKRQSKKSSHSKMEALTWTERGPGNVPGRTRGLVVFPDDPTHNTWLAGSVGGGIWKTTDGGTTWMPKTEDFPTLAISTLALAESNVNIVYAGTGETLANIGEIIGDGIFKSEDQGETWTQLSSTANDDKFKGISRIIVSPTDPQVILATTAGYVWNSDQDSYIMKSDDGGTTWTEVYTTSDPIDQIVATPDNFDVQYASVNEVGVLKSTDGGDTWADASIGLQPGGRLELAVSAVKTDRLFASVEGAVTGTGSDLYMSDDAGASWSIVLESENGTELDFLGGQGWYDNTIATDPYDEDIVYYGGVNLWRTTVQEGSGNSEIVSISVDEEDTDTFVDNVASSSNPYWGGALGLGAGLVNSDFATVEVRFGAGSQKAHRFTVPSGEGSGVPATDYTYQDYVDVPFQVWDIDNNKQLMVSFRDQQDDGVFNLLELNTTAGDEANHSREYLHVHTTEYNGAADANISVAGGQEVNQMYNMWTVLTAGGTWDALNLPVSILRINHTVTAVESRFGLTKNVSDAYQQFDDINTVFGNTDPYPFHPDQHNIIMVPIDAVAKTYQIISANDGGVFTSNIATEPGINDGDWEIKGLGYNTCQFYGADKKPGSNVYGAGAQDNGTWMSVADEDASKTSEYTPVISGDGFEVIWNYGDGNKFIGGSQFNGFRRTLDGGQTFSSATNGLAGSSPFISKLANSNSNPDVIFTVTSNGVFRSEDFGGQWVGTPITDGWGSGSLLNVEVSIADYNTVWAGVGMRESASFHVSTDNGLTFSRTNNYTETSLGSSSGLATHPVDKSTAYALFSFANSPKVLRTTDLGQTWEDISGFGVNTTSNNGFPDVAIYSLLVMPHDTDVIWAGTEIGIFESLDNGASWAYADNGLPAVSVWQMKVVDDQIVVATHGRGIWSVDIPELPAIAVTPFINALGTSPRGGLSMDVALRSAYDSTHIFVNGEMLFELEQTTAKDSIFNVVNVAVNDSLGVIVKSFDNGIEYLSTVKSIEVFEVNAAQNLYSNDFNAGTSDFYTEDNKFIISKFSGFDDIAIHSKHDYEEGDAFEGDQIEYITQLRTPIIINAENATFQYQDVAIIEPGESGIPFGLSQFYDYVIVEGTKDGFTWTPLLDGYDATFNQDWLNAYNNTSKGDNSMFVTHTIDMLNTFEAQDTVMFRFRLYSDQLTAAYGWVIDNIFIQDIPTGLTKNIINSGVDYRVYPNPITSDFANIEFIADKVGVLEVTLMDVRGVSYRQFDFAVKPGANIVNIDTQGLSSGTYFVKMNNSMQVTTKRIVIE